MIDEKKLIDELKQSGMIADNSYGNAMVDFINSQPKIGQWIPCSERLPEEYGEYLVAWKPLHMTKEQIIESVGRAVPHFYEIVEYDPDDDKKWIGYIEQSHGEYEIIAWQPLPAPYKESD